MSEEIMELIDEIRCKINVLEQRLKQERGKIRVNNGVHYDAPTHAEHHHEHHAAPEMEEEESEPMAGGYDARYM